MPVSTYRVQLRPPAEGHPGFGFDDAARIAPYLADLGVTHLYCSPYLQAAPGSAHGYDVVDHSRLNDELGGRAAFERLFAACRLAGLGIVLDIVPNHMAVSEPESPTSAAIVVAPSTSAFASVSASFAGLRAAAAQVCFRPGARFARYFATWRPVTLVAPKTVTSMSRPAIDPSYEGGSGLAGSITAVNPRGLRALSAYGIPRVHEQKDAGR